MGVHVPGQRRHQRPAVAAAERVLVLAEHAVHALRVIGAERADGVPESLVVLPVRAAVVQLEGLALGEVEPLRVALQRAQRRGQHRQVVGDAALHEGHEEVVARVLRREHALGVHFVHRLAHQPGRLGHFPLPLGAARLGEGVLVPGAETGRPAVAVLVQADAVGAGLPHDPAHRLGDPAAIALHVEAHAPGVVVVAEGAVGLDHAPRLAVLAPALAGAVHAQRIGVERDHRPPRAIHLDGLPQRRQPAPAPVVAVVIARVVGEHRLAGDRVGHQVALPPLVLGGAELLLQLVQGDAPRPQRRPLPPRHQLEAVAPRPHEVGAVLPVTDDRALTPAYGDHVHDRRQARRARPELPRAVAPVGVAPHGRVPVARVGPQRHVLRRKALAGLARAPQVLVGQPGPRHLLQRVGPSELLGRGRPGHVGIGLLPARHVFAQRQPLVTPIGVGTPDGQARPALRAEQVHHLVQDLVIAVAGAHQGRRVGDDPAAVRVEIVVVGRLVRNGQARQVRKGHLEIDRLLRPVGHRQSHAQHVVDPDRQHGLQAHRLAHERRGEALLVLHRGHRAALEVPRAGVALAAGLDHQQPAVVRTPDHLGRGDLVKQRRQAQPPAADLEPAAEIVVGQGDVLRGGARGRLQSRRDGSQ